MNVDISGFGKFFTDAEKTVLSGNADALNSFEKPEAVVPLKPAIKVSKAFSYILPSMSLTVIRIKTK